MLTGLPAPMVVALWCWKAMIMSTVLVDSMFPVYSLFTAC